jgi:UDP-N-acetylglucosamine--N-acetylmuramyl-(pentapeptide) pyrophosphoryl-undecaprenol N-acetylglucosamine transferase
MVPGLHLLAYAREQCRSAAPLHAAHTPEPYAPSASSATTGALPIGDVLWFTSGRSVEDRVMSSSSARGLALDIHRVVLPLEPEGGGAPSRSALVVRTPHAFMRARVALARHRSQVLLGLGGFTTLPAVLAARSLGIPVVLLEINARSGAATRWLRHFAARVLHAWPSTLPAQATIDEARAAQRGSRSSEVSGQGIHRWIGPPLPPSLCSGPPTPAEEARARAELGFDPDRPLLVVLGGSQGAGGLNAFLRAHAQALVAGGVQILHQTGPNKLGQGCPAFTGYRALEYADPIDRVLRAATVVLCRGGASTLAEIAALRRPAIVVPYPHHADRHQEENARELGAGVRIVPEARLGISVRNDLAFLCSAAAGDERAHMHEALRAALPTDGSRHLYEELCALGRGMPVRIAETEARA